MRVKRMMLLAELDDIKVEMTKFKDMLEAVAKKKENRAHRTHLLEHELTDMIPEDPSLPRHRFNALLFNKDGWHLVANHISRQYKRLADGKETEINPNNEDGGQVPSPDDEEIDTNLTIEDAFKCAYYLQVVQLVRTIECYARTGVKPEGKHHHNHKHDKNHKEEAKKEVSNENHEGIKPKQLDIIAEKKLFLMGQDSVVGSFNSALVVMGSAPHPKKTLKSTVDEIYNFLLNDEYLVSNGVIDKSVLNDLGLSVNETQSTEEHSDFVAINLSKIADCLTKEIEKTIITSLRMLASWPKMLEKYRKERLRRIGQKMTKIANDVEVDKQGSVRVIPNADEIIDTDIFHGAMQRMHINVVEPETKKRIVLLKEKRDEIRCELACLSQFFYLYISTFAQKCGRGLIVRRRAYRERRALVYQAMHAAASNIQAWIKALKGKRKFAAYCATLADNVQLLATIKLQAFIRMWVKWRKYYLYAKDKKDRRIYWGIVKMQSAIRRYNARCRVLKMKSKNSEQLQQEVSEWGVVQIQKLVRGFIARKTIVKSFHIRNSIAPEVLTLAEKYLKKGNLWSFLKEIDFIMKHYQSDINEMEKREDAYATTFIQKVLNQRQGQFDGAWNRFSKSALSHTRGGTANKGMADSDGKLSALAADNSISKWTDSSPATNQSPGRTSTLDQSIPGPMLRRAVTATIKEGIKQELEKTAKDISRTAELTNNIKKVYGGGGGSVGVKGKKKKLLSNKKNFVSDTISIGSKTLSTSNVISAKATSVDWVGAFESNSPSKNDTFKLSPIKKNKNNQRLFFSGESLLIDVPKGVNDSIERIFKAAAIRCYVPAFFADDDKEKAYSIYLQMPIGLPKLKYEQEAFKICQPILNKFNAIGLSKIQDVMPLSKFKTFMKNYKTPPLLMYTIIDIFYILQKMGDFALGKNHEDSQNQNKLFQEDKATMDQTISAIESNILETMTSDDYISSINNKNGKGSDGKDDQIDPSLPSRLLLSMVESGPWASLKASVEDLITHAAYIIVEHKRQVPHTNKFEIIETGHNAFKAHIQDLQLMSEENKKEAIKHRFRSALIMSTPFYLKLKVEGVLLVEDLLKVDFSSLNMPPMLQKQVEALLNVAVYAATNAKAAFTVRDHLSTNKEMFTIPMLYDPKFQRSPFDPYGRQPRFNALQKLIKLRTKEDNLKLKRDKIRKKETPKGLFENPNTDDDEVDNFIDLKKKTNFYNFKEVHQSNDTNVSNNIHENNMNINHENMSSIQSISLNTNQDFNSSMHSYEKSETVETTLASPNIKIKSDQKARVGRVNRLDGTRPYVCHETNCGAAFSRLYTLKIHQKSHTLFSNYHSYKRDPQLYLDPDEKDLQLQKEREFEQSYSLSDLVLQELNNLEQGYGVDTYPIFPPLGGLTISREENNQSRSGLLSRSSNTRGSSRGSIN